MTIWPGIGEDEREGLILDGARSGGDHELVQGVGPERRR
jgi:hypothetical protein